MFQFTTTTVINNPVLGTSWTLLDSNKLFKVLDGPGFKKDDVHSYEIFKADYKAETPDTITVDLSEAAATTGVNRLVLYIRSVGNADPMYANDFVFKGKPLYVEYATGATAADVKKLAEKFLLALYNTPVVKLTADGTNLTITGVNGYLRFHYVALEEWTEDTTTEGGHFEVVESTSKEDSLSVTVGCEGFGTYEQVLKDLRLPTGDNLAYKSLNEMEMPVLGGKYTQVTVRMCADLKNYPGGIGVNNPVKSITDHVFFINGETAASAFVADLKTVTNVDAVEVPTTTTTSTTPSAE